MTFTGTLIEDLMAAVERVEPTRDVLLAGDAENVTCHDESTLEQSWFASLQETTEYDPKLLGVA
jgi:hypothetical protein